MLKGTVGGRVRGGKSEERRVSCMRRRVVTCFFSSRRRHTRYWRDWSSDVCSSDLMTAGLISSTKSAGERPRLLSVAPQDTVAEALAQMDKYGVTQMPVMEDGKPVGSVRENRSEEHTSELQSRQYLVCRLLLDKKLGPRHREPGQPSNHRAAHPRSALLGGQTPRAQATNDACFVTEPLDVHSHCPTADDHFLLR